MGGCLVSGASGRTVDTVTVGRCRVVRSETLARREVGARGHVVLVAKERFEGDARNYANIRLLCRAKPAPPLSSLIFVQFVARRIRRRRAKSPGQSLVDSEEATPPRFTYLATQDVRGSIVFAHLSVRAWR